jgi:outer membrane lipoprotein-sorting protein
MRCAMSRTLPVLAGILLLVLACFAVPAAHAQSAQEVIAKADVVRNPNRSFRLTSTLSDYVGGKLRDQNVVNVYASPNKATGQFRNLVRYLAPPRDAGKAALLDGTALWFYDPASKASVRISPQQRLTGQAAIGDVLTVNLAVDYIGKLVGIEQIMDAEHQTRTCWHLDMRAATPTSTYNRVEYWVDQQAYRPLKAKFYSDSGRLLKILYYRAFKDVLNADRPTEAIIIDAVDSTQVTLVAFSDWRFVEVSDAWFQRDYLSRLPAE